MSQAEIDRQNKLAARRVARYRFNDSRSMVGGFVGLVRAEIEAAYSRGYSAGHEEQMQARIRDAMERWERPA